MTGTAPARALQGCAAAAMAMLIALTPAAAQRSAPETGDLVEIDAVVLDRQGNHVRGLTLQDFDIKEDGRAVEIKTFAEHPGSDDAREPRHLALLLDDSSVPMNGTSVVRDMAAAIIFDKAPADEITVVRLNNDRDEPFGDIETAVQRIRDYHAGIIPFHGVSTPERALKAIAAIARQFESYEHSRKAIVCVGGPRVCNVLEPQPVGYGLNWNHWVAAIAGAARANTAVYGAMPVAPGTQVMLSGGIIERTGGDAFVNAGDYDAFTGRVWREMRSYYLLGYWPAGERRYVHTIDVKVRGKGLRVRTRRER